MAAARKKSSKSPNLDEIKPLDSSVSDTEEKEEVISVRIPNKSPKKAKKETPEPEIEEEKDSKAEKVKVEVKKEEKVDAEEEAETKVNNLTEKDDPSPEPEKSTETVSSFRMLDKEDDTKEEATEAKKEESDLEESKDDASDENAPEKEDKTEEVRDWLDDSSEEDDLDDEGGGKMKIFVIALAIVILLGIVGGGIFYYQSSINTTDEVDVIVNDPPAQIPTDTPKPTEVPEEEIDVSEYSIQVLNGTGVAGKAGKASDTLVSVDFTEADTGNASSSNFTETEVSMKEDSPSALFTQIKSALEDEYVLVLVKETLDEDSEYDAVITLGSDKPDKEAEVTPAEDEEAGI